MVIPDSGGIQGGVSGLRRSAGNRVIQVNSSSGGAGPFPVITSLTAPIPIVNVTLSTIGVRSPAIVLNFSGIVSVPINTIMSLNFEVLRSMDNAAIKVGSTYTISGTFIALTSQSVGFQLLDNNLQPGNYTYSVQLSQNSTIVGAAGLTITNAVLSAIVSENVF